MTQIDDAIRQALSAEDAKVLERYGADQPLSQQILDVFRGRMGPLNAIVWVVAVALFAATLMLGWRFLTAPDVAGMLRWGAATGVAVLTLMIIKLWAWMEIQKNAILREVKRLELQVARLAAR
ncbi:MAG: DUF6768 family protein [Phenylobacterium sp.]